MDQTPTGTTTFLFTDIEGSSRMWESHPDEMSSSLATHDSILSDAIDRHGGYVFSRGGDAFAAAFPRASDGVAAALEARRALAAHKWGATEIRVRMGLHTGEAEERDGDYFGQALNRGARLMAAAHGGQIVVSAPTADLVRERMPAGATLVDHGSHSLRDVSEPIRVFEVVDVDVADDFPPLHTLHRGTGSLPNVLTDVIGRDTDVAQVAELLSTTRLVTLTGPGGVGKTVLAVEVADRVDASHVDGVWFVPLAETADPSLVPKQIASALGIQEQADRAVMATVVDQLGERDLLVVLDNCEHLIDAAAQAAHRLLGSLPNVRLLATSRQPLGVPGEQVWSVPALPVPTGSEDPMSSPAVRLFVQRARSVDIGFAPDLETLLACAEICRRVDGLPLAIELAAARIRVMSAGEIADRLGSRIDLLGGSGRGTERRQVTMRAAIAWSYELLSVAERTMFRRLAVFRGGFTLEAAESIMGDDRDAAVELLGRLIDQSLVVSVRAPGSRRFSMLETVRAYAAERLDASDEGAQMRDRHRDFFSDWARTQARSLASADQLVALEALEADHDNLRAVLTRSFESGDVERAVLLAADMSFFWWLHSHFGESEAWCNRLMAASSSVGPRSRAKFMVGAGQMAMGVCHYDLASERFEVAHRLATEAGSQRLAAWSLANAMTNETYQLHLDEARALGRSALASFEAIGDTVGAGYVGYMNVAIDFAHGARSGTLDADDADRLVERLVPAHTAAELIGERNFLGHTTELMGSIALLGGRIEEAGSRLAGAIAALDALGNQSCLAHAIERVALYAAHTGRQGDAVELVAAADGIRRRVGVETRIAEAEISGRVVAECRQGLAEVEYERSWSAGSGLLRADAVEKAMRVAQA